MSLKTIDTAFEGNAMPVFKEVKLKEIVTDNCLGGNYQCVEYVTPLPVIKMGNLGRGTITLEKMEYVSDGKILSNRDVLKKKDILLNTRNTLDLVGKVAMWRGELEYSVFNSNIMRITFSTNVLNEYMNYYFNSYSALKQLRSRATGTTSVAAIYWRDCQNIRIPLPSLSEQKAIVALLSTWDIVIEKTERLVQTKERQKLGELHSRISRKKANSTIGTFAKPVVRKVDKPEESYIALGIRSHFKGTFKRLVEDPKTVNMDSLFRVKENDLIVNITFAWEGAIALVKKEDEECYVSHRFPTYEIKRSKAEPCFIRQLIMSSRMKYDLSNISPGGAGRNRVLNKKDFLKMPIWLPDLETQKNIGEYLGAIDNEIDLLKQLAEKYKTQKHGLMQKMLTGEWRIKPEIVNQYMEA
ncbi:MAG: restriction endonuclease subunit S [Spirochaetales bacterium]|nr:restriction endonuclease subunit S [Spirochaetales bacterium]